MSFFRRESSAPPLASHPAAAAPPHPSTPSGVTHIAPGTRITGTVSGKTPLKVDGEVVGEVRIEAALTIGADGVVEGPVEAKSVLVAGRLTGNVTATERVEIAATGNLEGTVATPRFVTAEGAFFKGRVEMAQTPQTPQSARGAGGSPENSKNRDPRRGKPAGEAKQVESEREGTPSADRNS